MGDARKRSWSREDKIRRVGTMKLRVEGFGGGGSMGVSGMGRGFWV